jgi:hypothetical protein
MALKVKQTTGKLPSILPADEAVAMFDREARRVVGMSGAEFIARWDAGEYEDVDLDSSREGRDIIGLSGLIPFGRQTRQP